MQKTLNRGAKVVIFGASLSGRSALSAISEHYDVLAFVDNDSKKYGANIEGIPIVSPTDIAALAPDKILIASEFFEQIEKQLHQLVPQIKVEVLPARQIKPIQLENSHRQGQTAVELLLTLSKNLTSLEVPHYIDAGTLLGVYRDNALIPWDDDLDFSIDANYLDHSIAVIEQQLPQLFALTGVTWTLHKYVNQQAYGAVPIGAIRALKLLPNDDAGAFPGIDFFVKYIQGDYMDYCLASRGFRMPAKHFSAIQSHPFAGGVVNLPSHVEAYLERHYGEWQVPQKDWSLSDVKSATVFTAES
ncbi:LicD family protein [Paraglaciecola aquimarina]|uniref:LicD family protein n=1 Tax=Paraglaciecola aquimarina TaxID=1235557 RepID=A0ABU3T0C2_9ALTE|nr:LicD family protein [Paraglaciecola aquimarina]MDU0355713.1 LicD family protein [Paraglaciecola aquimarina]